MDLNASTQNMCRRKVKDTNMGVDWGNFELLLLRMSPQKESI